MKRQYKSWRTAGSTQTGHLSSRILDISDIVLRARLRNTPDLKWLQQVAWHNQSKAGADLIRDISGLRRHLPKGFTQCRPNAYSPSIIIELTELLYRQPAPADPADSARVAKKPATDPVSCRPVHSIVQLH